MARTKLYPMVQFKKDTWEIDEFDIASMYLLVGTEKAMLIDCGMGVGDLKGAVEMLIGNKPLIVVITHGHLDHTANAIQFPEIWMHPADQDQPIPQSYERRRGDVEKIAVRQKGCIGAPYTMFHLYPYDIDEDLLEYGPEVPRPVIHDLYDCQQFDLGGGRIVTAIACPGHSKGQMAFLDSQTRSLFSGDAVNFNLGINACPVETSLKSLKRLKALESEYDGIYNGHHDFRALGAPLDPEALDTAIAMCEEIVTTGKWIPTTSPSFWGQSVPLSRTPKPSSPGRPFRVCTRRGRNWLFFDPKKIREEEV